MSRYPARIRIGTRGSALARWQADHVAARLHARGIEVAIEIIQTRGDLDQRTAFGRMSAKGIFVKEIEDALLSGRIDLAVHSLKDLPTELAPGLRLAAVLERESPLDALFSRAGRTLQDLPPGARVATGSLRRAAQVLAMRPDFEIAPLRGNVPTRIEKIRRGEADATLLALAGLRRLGLEEVVTQVLASDQVTPPMGQGILGLEARAGEWDELWAAIEHAPTRRLADAERAWLARVGGGCRTPAGVLAEPRDPDGWSITAVLATPDGKHLLRRRIEVPARSEPSDRADASDRPDKSDESDLPALRTAAVRLAETMLAAADPAILATLRTSG